MAFFTTEKELSFAERIDNVQLMFTNAYNEAQSIKEDLVKDNENKQVQINTLNQEIEKNATLITKTTSFMNKLKDIIG